MEDRGLSVSVNTDAQPILEIGYCVGTIRDGYDGPWVSVSTDHYDADELEDAFKQAAYMTEHMGREYKVFAVESKYLELSRG